MSSELPSRTALITGATSGIGRATALALARAGARVVLSGRDATRGAEVVDGIRATGGEAFFVAADLTGADGARYLAEQAIAVAGDIDVLVNNAGLAPTGPTEAMSEQQFDDLYALNLKAPFFLVGALAPAMASRGHGAIVNVSSMVGEFGLAGTSLYGSSKAALVLLTKAWAAEYGPRGVRVNAVSPGPTRTEGSAVLGDGIDHLAAAAPAGRAGTPEEIADAIVYLASDRASFVHGVLLPVDGGRLAV